MRSFVLCTVGLVVCGLLVSAAPALAADLKVVGGCWSGGSVIGALLCGFIASTKRHNPWGWALGGFFCCPIALILLLLSGPGSYR